MANNNTIVAVDPGATGSAAFFVGGALQMVHGFKGSLTDMRLLYDSAKSYCPAKAYVENVHAMRRDGKKSAFTFGRRKAEIETVLFLADVELVLVDINAWPKLLGLPKRYEIADEKKRRAARRADQEALVRALYPAVFREKEADVWASVLIGYAQVMQSYPDLKGWLMQCRRELGWNVK